MKLNTNFHLALFMLGCLVLGIALRHLWLMLMKKRQANKGRVPDHNTRRWARAMYHNGLISLAELNKFYEEHPEAENGNGGTS